MTERKGTSDVFIKNEFISEFRIDILNNYTYYLVENVMQILMANNVTAV